MKWKKKIWWVNKTKSPPDLGLMHRHHCNMLITIIRTCKIVLFNFYCWTWCCCAGACACAPLVVCVCVRLMCLLTLWFTSIQHGFVLQFFMVAFAFIFIFKTHNFLRLASNASIWFSHNTELLSTMDVQVHALFFSHFFCLLKRNSSLRTSSLRQYYMNQWFSGARFFYFQLCDCCVCSDWFFSPLSIFRNEHLRYFWLINIPSAHSFDDSLEKLVHLMTITMWMAWRILYNDRLSIFTYCFRFDSSRYFINNLPCSSGSVYNSSQSVGQWANSLHQIKLPFHCFNLRYTRFGE